ncbi:class I SAM-dependent methyltransferase [Novosphingobium huizhouense]|uniref:class I SAM-dependent methyltransferase n=1 Tax=Novosphingobium huizhouense TaxID=2866625 RepID=UPI001CD90C47|nr:class I SAM-dependent methyltransferase [Novosphingobium huizhouense]
MFTKTARFYDALYSFKDYEGASRTLTKIIGEECPDARTLLDVGCGTGRHLETLGRTFEVAGLDLDAGLVAVARERNPATDIRVADMTDFDTGRTYDVVTCLFSAIAYVETRERMEQAIAAMARHVAPGGLLIVEPWFGPETYWEGHLTGNFHDEPDLKISWIYLNGREGDVSVLDIHYTVGTPAGVEQFREVHRMGLFRQDEYEAAFARNGLTCRYDPKGLFDRGLFIGARPHQR